MKQDSLDELREMIFRLDERMKALIEKIDNYMKSVECDYEKKVDFEKWVAKEFSPVKEKVEGSERIKWFIFSGIGGAIMLSIADLVLK